MIVRFVGLLILLIMFALPVCLRSPIMMRSGLKLCNLCVAGCTIPGGSCMVSSSPRALNSSSCPFRLVGVSHCRGAAPLPTTSTQTRNLMIRPDGTVDPVRFPLGYIPITGKETLDVLFTMLKEGHFICAETNIETTHYAFVGVSRLIEREFNVSRDVMVDASRSDPTVTGANSSLAEMKQRSRENATLIDEIIFMQAKKKDILDRILLKRDFWNYEDFNDKRMNASFGVQNKFFDNYQWSQYLAFQFQTFAEKWLPASSHTHITYRQYLSLIVYFAAQVKGVSMSPILPASYKLHPPYLVPYPPPGGARQPIDLLGLWLSHFKSPLMIRKLLVVNGGCGVVGMMAKYRGIPMVRVVDPSAIAMQGAKADAERMGPKFRGVSFQTVSDLFPPLLPPEKQHAVDHARAKGTAPPPGLVPHDDYNAIVYHADMPILRALQGSESPEGDSYRFAPGLSGYTRDLEAFFEQASRHLSKSGVIVILSSNLYSLAYPDRPNPIELEIKANRRWMVVDYYDRPMNAIGREFQRGTNVGVKQNVSGVGLRVEDFAMGGEGSGGVVSPGAGIEEDSSLSILSSAPTFRNKLRSELWVLHRVDALEEFGWLHGIPGAQVPSSVLKHWNRKKLRNHRVHMIKKQVELHGGDWGEYKTRMLRVLQDNGENGDEDDEAVQIRMALDPTYPEVLAKRARAHMERKAQEMHVFHETSRRAFGALANTSSSAEHGLSPRDDFDLWADKVAESIRSRSREVGGRPLRSSERIIGTAVAAPSQQPFFYETISMSQPPAGSSLSRRGEGEQSALIGNEYTTDELRSPLNVEGYFVEDDRSDSQVADDEDALFGSVGDDDTDAGVAKVAPSSIPRRSS